MAPYTVGFTTNGPDTLGFPSGTYYDGKRVNVVRMVKNSYDENKAKIILFKFVAYIGVTLGCIWMKFVALGFSGSIIYPGVAMHGWACANQAPGKFIFYIKEK